MFHRITIKVA